MSNTEVFRNYFADKEEAILEIAKEGKWPISWVDKAGYEYPNHCHRDEETLYVVKGAIDITDTTTGDVHSLNPGDKLFLPARRNHSARSENGAVYIMGVRTLVALDDHALPPETTHSQAS